MDDSLFGPPYKSHLKRVEESLAPPLERKGLDSLTIASGPLEHFYLDDNHLPFKANPFFQYLVPGFLNRAKQFITFYQNKRPTLFYFSPDDFWHVQKSLPQGDWSGPFEIREFKKWEELEKALKQLGPKGAYIGPENSSDSFLSSFKSANDRELILKLEHLRVKKTEFEINLMEKANDLGVRGHLKVEKGLSLGLSEGELVREFLSGVETGENQLPYKPIMAQNENGAILHYDHLSFERKNPGELHSLLIDAGAFVHGRASDISRTYSVKDSEFKEMISWLDKIQVQLCHETKAGVHFIELHERAMKKVAQFLNEFQFVNLSPEEIFESKVSHTFFPHGLGHLLGVQVHDVGGKTSYPDGEFHPSPDDYPFLRFTQTIQEGQVLTIEPGVYFISSLLEKWKSSPLSVSFNWSKIENFKKFGGIRIEDNVHVSSNGPENLTRKAFKRAIMS